MLTVRCALKIGGLASSKLVAGHQGLDNEICSVDIIEVPDIRDWIEPNELGVTCGYAIRENSQAQELLIRAMAENNAAALAVKPGRYLGGSMPKVMIDAANETGLPLIEVPVDIPYVQITLPILSQILNEQASRLQYESHVHGVLMQCVIENQGIESIARTTSRIVGSPVLILDQNGRPLTSCNGNLDHKRIRTFLKENFCLLGPDNNEEESISTGFDVYLGDLLCIPAIGKGGVLGYLIVDRSKQGELNVFEETALKEAVTVIVLELTKHRIIQETETNLKRQFLLEHGLPQLVTSAQSQDRAKLSELDFADPYVVIVAKLYKESDKSSSGHTKLWSNERLDSMLDWVKEPEVMQWLPVFLDEGKDELTLLCSRVDCAGEGRLSEYTMKSIRHLRREISLSIGVETLFGVSKVHIGTKYFEAAAEEARKAIDIGQSVAISDKVLPYQDMAVYEFISNVDTDIRAQYATANLSPLLSEDSNPDFITTLAVFLQCGGQVTEASRKLYIHRNTLNYRLEKISQLLGCDVKEASNQFRLRLALMAGYLSGVVQR